MKKIIRDTLKIWLILLISCAIFCIFISVPILVGSYIEFEPWGFILDFIWFTFWISLLVVLYNQ